LCQSYRFIVQSERILPFLFKNFCFFVVFFSNRERERERERERKKEGGGIVISLVFSFVSLENDMFYDLKIKK